MKEINLDSQAISNSWNFAKKHTRRKRIIFQFLT